MHNPKSKNNTSDKFAEQESYKIFEQCVNDD